MDYSSGEIISPITIIIVIIIISIISIISIIIVIIVVVVVLCSGFLSGIGRVRVRSIYHPGPQIYMQGAHALEAFKP